MLDRLFVYGTLMRGIVHPMSKLLSRSADFIGDACIQGRLYMVAHYPGMLLSDASGDVVHGELYRMHDPDTLLKQLDDYEGCGSGFSEPNAYLRLVVPVTQADGSLCEAWTYIYNWDVDENRRIVSGRFLER